MLSVMENSQRAMDSRLKTTEERADSWEHRLAKIENNLASNNEKDRMNEKVDSIPVDLTTIGKDFEKEKVKINELATKAEKVIEKVEKSSVQSEGFERVKSTGVQNSNRLDKIQKDDKMLNLLLSNLLPNIQNITGFARFNEMSQGDILYIYKVFESTTRIVHVVRFRSLEIRNEPVPESATVVGVH